VVFDRSGLTDGPPAIHYFLNCPFYSYIELIGTQLAALHQKLSSSQKALEEYESMHHLLFKFFFVSSFFL
jgi:hypothetical protein